MKSKIKPALSATIAVFSLGTLMACSSYTVVAAEPEPVFVAQHQSQHSREGHIKLAEPGTGDIADRAASATGSESVVQREKITFNSDSIAERTDPVAVRVRELVADHHPIIDIHGMSDQHGADVEIGTGRHLTTWEGGFVACAAGEMKDHGWTVKENADFSGTRNWTISGYAESISDDNSVVQVELTPELRSEHRGEVADILSGCSYR